VNFFTVVTLFPEFIESFRGIGIVRRACERGIIDVQVVNPRDFASDARGTVDDSPYGGGPGMVMAVAPLRRSIAAARSRVADTAAHVIYMTPQGRRLDHEAFLEFSRIQHLVFVAGRYEGIDERVVEQDIDAEWSLGDFVLSGGELPAMAVIDATVRLLPGALGDPESAIQDSFVDGLLDHPHYTRPEVVDGQSVPPILLSGDHAAVRRWRRKQSLGRTWLRRPEILEACSLSPDDRALLAEFEAEIDTE
jgi:tRNA (guanine37-N1)-methyltransferase